MTGQLSRQDQALRLHRAGLTVMMAREGGKIPLGGSWQASQRPTEDQIAKWWGGNPRLNISVLTGRPSGVFVLDIDPKAGGMESMARLVERHGPPPATYVVQTGGGGWHYYFQMPDFDFANKAGSLKLDEQPLPGLDIRANGGQVVAAGSQTTGPYLEAAPGLPIAFAPAPGWLLEMLRPKEAPERVETVADRAPTEYDRFWTSAVSAELARLATMPDGAWHDIALSVATKVWDFVRSDWCSLTDAEAEQRYRAAMPPVTDGTDASWAQHVDDILAFVRARDGVRTPPPRLEKTPDELVAAMIAEIQAQQGGVDQPALGGEVTAGGEDLHEWTEVGLANRVVERHKHRLRFVAHGEEDRGAWHVYRDGAWVKESVAGTRAVEETVRALEATEGRRYSRFKTPDDDGKVPAKSEWEQFNTWRLSMGRNRVMLEVAKLMSRRHELRVEPGVFDRQAHLLNARGGTVDLRSGERIPHSPEQMLSIQTPVDFDPHAQAPMFNQFLNQMQPDPLEKAALQRIAGYTLLGGNPEHLFFVHHGATGSGKSTFMEIASHVLGEYARALDSSSVMRQRNEPHTQNIARLEGSRLAYLDETSEHDRLYESRMKQLTGASTFVARGMRENDRPIAVTFAIHIVTNWLPRMSDDPALRRRVKVIEWPVQVPESAKSVNLAQRIAEAEGPGILAWLVAGAVEYHRAGLQLTEKINSMSAAYSEEGDFVGVWRGERAVLSTGPWTPATELFADFSRWSEEHGWSPGDTRVSNTSYLGRRLAKQPGLESRRTSSGMVWNLTLLPRQLPTSPGFVNPSPSVEELRKITGM